MTIKFAMKIVQLKVCIIFSQSDDLALHSRSPLNLTNVKLVLDLDLDLNWIR